MSFVAKVAQPVTGQPGLILSNTGRSSQLNVTPEKISTDPQSMSKTTKSYLVESSLSLMVEKVLKNERQFVVRIDRELSLAALTHLKLRMHIVNVGLPFNPVCFRAS